MDFIRNNIFLLEENNHDGRCQGPKDKFIGYTNDLGNIVLIIISILGIVINSSFFIISIRKIIISNKEKNNRISSIEKILCIISLTETFISICWLINSFFMKDSERLVDHCNTCRVIGLTEVFLYLFDWMILVATLIQIKNMLIKPLESFKTVKFIRKYIFFSFLFSVFNVILAYLSEMEGLSPMLTCFIRVTGWDYEKGYKTVFYMFFFVVPFCILLFGIYQVYIITHLPEYDKNNKKFFRSYLFYVLAYIILALLLILVYVANYFKDSKDKEPNSYLKLYIQINTFISCSTPLIVGTIRLFKTNIIKRVFSCKSKNKLLNNGNIDYNYNEDLNSNNRKTNNEKDTLFFEFEKNQLCTEFKKIFIGISYVLDKYKNYSDNAQNNTIDNSIYNINNSITDIQIYHITKKEILKDLDLLIN